MGETSTFLTMTGVATVLAIPVILSARSIATARTIAKAFYCISTVLSFAALLWIILDSIGALSRGVESPGFLRLLIYRGWIVIGTGIGSAVLILIAVGMSVQIGDAAKSFLASPYLLKGLCLSVSISFICTEIGKVAQDGDMRQFFIQSGYSVWFLYFIIVAEVLGAVALLFHRTLRPAAFGLTFIMAGAIATHHHNRDPFSDSLEALHLLVLLACIVVTHLLRRKLLPHSNQTDAGRPVPIGPNTAEA